MAAEAPPSIIKVCVVGHKSAGKSSMIHRYLGDGFKEGGHDPTIENVLEKQIKGIGDKHQKHTVQIYDTVGVDLHADEDSPYRELVRNTIAVCVCFLVVVCHDDLGSFETAKKLLRDIEELTKDRIVSQSVILVANKTDTDPDRVSTVKKLVSIQQTFSPLVKDVFVESAKDSPNCVSIGVLISMALNEAMIDRSDPKRFPLFRPDATDLLGRSSSLSPRQIRRITSSGSMSPPIDNLTPDPATIRTPSPGGGLPRWKN
jgi:small GTP-binding protein